MIRYLKRLRSLYMSFNRLIELPASLGDLDALRVLHLNENKLTAFPEVFVKLSNLTELCVSKNVMPTLQVQFEVLTGLKLLNIEGNLLTSPPAEVINHGTALIMEYIARLKVARETRILNFEHMHLRAVPAEVLRTYTALRTLNVSNNSLRTLPYELQYCPRLLSLQCENNKISELPHEICLLTDLTYLNLNSNDLSSLPSGIGKLTGLTALWVQRNPLSSLPSDLRRLTNLAELQLQVTDLATCKAAAADIANEGPKYPPREILLRGEDAVLSFSEKVKDARVLGKLDLSNMALRSLPLQACGISQLLSLDISFNLFTQLPDEISCLLNLKVMSIMACTRLFGLPISMGRLSNLTELDLRETKLVTPPKVVQQWETEDMLDYLSRFVTRDVYDA